MTSGSDGNDVSTSEPTVVRVGTDDRIVTLTLDSPANRNALSRRMVAELTAAVEAAGADEAVHGILLTSSHRVFCAGLDLTEALSGDITDLTQALIGLQRALAAAPVPVVVRLDGPVRAGGLGIVAAADLVLADAQVSFALTEVRLGLAAAVIAPTVFHRLGSRTAADLTLTARTIDATQAAAAGLVTRAVPTADLDSAVSATLDDLRAASRQGLTHAKGILNADLLARLDHDGPALARLSASLFASPEAQRLMRDRLAR